MGHWHWSETLTEDAVRMLGGNPDRQMVVDLLAQAGRELDIL